MKIQETTIQDSSSRFGDWPCVEIAYILANGNLHSADTVQAAKQELRRRSFSTAQITRAQRAFADDFAQGRLSHA